FINPDEKTAAYARSFSKFKDFQIVTNDSDVKYEKLIDIDVSNLEPQIACPPTVGNVKPVSEAAGLSIHIAEIGGSTGGRLDDLRIAAACLRGQRVPREVRLQIVPANRTVCKSALHEGLIEVLH